jgi:hypothetical protein
MTGGDAVRDCKADPTVRILDAAQRRRNKGKSAEESKSCLGKVIKPPF